METKELLTKELADEFEILSDADVMSDEAKMAVNNIEKLYKLKIEDDRVSLEREKLASDAAMRERESAIREAELKENKIDRYFRTGQFIVDKAVTIAFYGSCFAMGMYFEKEGVLKSRTFSDFLRMINPKK